MSPPAFSIPLLLLLLSRPVERHGLRLDFGNVANIFLGGEVCRENRSSFVSLFL